MTYRYNQEDDCIEDAELRVIGRPFATIDEGQEVKHERGRNIADGLNLLNTVGSVPIRDTRQERQEYEKNKATGPVPESLGSVVDFLLPVGVRQILSLLQKKSLDRIERKHKKLVKKLIAKAAIEAAKGAV